MVQSFISVNNNIDIDVKSGEFVINASPADQVKISFNHSGVDQGGHSTPGFISIKTAQHLINDVISVIDPILEYHGIEAETSNNSIIINDSEYLEQDTIDALELAVKGLNTYLK